MEDARTCAPSSFGRGIRDDVARRLPFYLSDWTDAFNWKVLSATLFIFFTSIGPAITFSLLLALETNDEIGAIEVLVATSITGVLFAVFAGQPLLIVGVTGPVAILSVNIYIVSEMLGIKFIPFYAWSQIWGAAMLIVLAVFNACDTLKFVTRFSCDIFGILIALLYLYTGIEGIARALDKQRADFGVSLLQFIIAMGTFYTADTLSHASGWSSLNGKWRGLINDYGATVAILVWSTVPAMAANRMEDGAIPKLYVPLTFETTSGRTWFADFSDIPVWGVFAAIVPGFIITVLFFFDHNVSSLLAQKSEYKLKKGDAFHLDFLVLGIGVLLTGLLGIPPTNGLIPQAPLHTKSLTVTKRIVADAGILAADRFEIVNVHEQRVSNLLQSLLIGLVCFRPFSDALREIPIAVLYGLFLYLGLSSFEGNEFAYRMYMICMDKKIRRRTPHPYASAQVKYPILRSYTLLQALLCGIIFGITFTPAGVIFPVLIAALVAVRSWGLSKWFTEDHLNLLDSQILAQPKNAPNFECFDVEIIATRTPDKYDSAGYDLDGDDDSGDDAPVIWK